MHRGLNHSKGIAKLLVSGPSTDLYAHGALAVVGLSTYT